MVVVKYVIVLAFRRQCAPHLQGMEAPQHSENAQIDERFSQFHAAQELTQCGFGGANPSPVPLPLR